MAPIAAHEDFIRGLMLLDYGFKRAVGNALWGPVGKDDNPMVRLSLIMYGYNPNERRT